LTPAAQQLGYTGRGRMRAVRWPSCGDEVPMEFLNFVLIFFAGYLVVRSPERERLAFTLAVVSAALVVFLFFLASRTSILPGVNY
jgi:hypothetical protein